MNAQLKLIQAQCPSWATVALTKGALEVVARVVLPSGRPDVGVTLQVTAPHGRISVKERPPRRWPIGCPERHINRNGTFCLGVGDPIEPDTKADADDWWYWLSEFILSQRVADESGIWPNTRSLHHGDAYKHQKKMEDLAEGSPFQSEVTDALEGGDGWLAGEIPRLSKDGKRLVNLRAPCPRGCLRRKHPILRRKCKQKFLIYELIKHEHLRREEESKFWAEFEGRPCCETMKQCPLRTGGG